MLASLENETIFKHAFTDKTVFKSFVKDIVGIDIEVDKIETEKRFEPRVGNIDFAYDIFAESTDHRVIIEIQRVDYDYNLDRVTAFAFEAFLDDVHKVFESFGEIGFFKKPGRVFVFIDAALLGDVPEVGGKGVQGQPSFQYVFMRNSNFPFSIDF
jgi:hypothetical protein